jgi:hypothetical protein
VKLNPRRAFGHWDWIETDDDVEMTSGYLISLPFGGPMTSLQAWRVWRWHPYFWMLSAPGIFGSLTPEQRRRVFSSDAGETSGDDEDGGET